MRENTYWPGQRSNINNTVSSLHVANTFNHVMIQPPCPKGVTGNSVKIGLVLEMAVTFHFNKHGIEIRTYSLADDGSKSWIVLCSGVADTQRSVMCSVFEMTKAITLSVSPRTEPRSNSLKQNLENYSLFGSCVGSKLQVIGGNDGYFTSRSKSSRRGRSRSLVWSDTLFGKFPRPSCHLDFRTLKRMSDKRYKQNSIRLLPQPLWKNLVPEDNPRTPWDRKNWSTVVKQYQNSSQFDTIN